MAPHHPSPLNVAADFPCHPGRLRLRADRRWAVHSINVQAVTCSADGTSASIFGTATINGAGSVLYRIEVKGLGEPGTTDTYRIRLGTGYDSGVKVISGGNVQIH